MRKLALFALLLAIPSIVQAKTLEDLLVEKGVITAGEARTSAAASDAKVYWNNGTRLEFPDNGFTTRINTQLQTSYKFTDYDKDLRKAGFAAKDKSSFGVDRARLVLSGTALNKEFSYKLQTEFASASGDTDAHIKDAYVQWEPCEGMGYRLGQFKTAVSRQWNVSSTSLQIPVRSVASERFDMGRQAGLRAFYNDLDGNYSMFASIYNGESDGEGGIGSGEGYKGVDTRHAFDAAIRGNIMGRMDPFVEGDIDMTEELAINAGAAYSYSDAKNSFGPSIVADGKIHRVSADVNAKYNGFSFNAEFFWGEMDYDFEKDSRPVGFYLQSGYFFTPEFEVALRYSFLNCDESRGDVCSFKGTYAGTAVDDVNEAAISLNYYFWKNNLKAQLAYIFMDQDVYSRDRDDYGTEDINTNVWMLQFSAYL